MDVLQAIAQGALGSLVLLGLTLPLSVGATVYLDWLAPEPPTLIRWLASQWHRSPSTNTAGVIVVVGLLCFFSSPVVALLPWLGFSLAQQVLAAMLLVGDVAWFAYLGRHVRVKPREHIRKE
jgi:hypothetical protein